MNRILILSAILFSLTTSHVYSQNTYSGINQIDEDGNITTSSQRKQHADSLGTDKEIPKGIKVWTIDTRFGDRRNAVPDTLSYMYMNSIFTEGLRGEYNTLGNLASPRINRIFIDRPFADQFIFTQPYDYFLTKEDQFHFTNTLSPFTNLSYNNCGNRTNGEDHFTAKFGVNAGKRIGVGFKFDYTYGRGYYQNQSTAMFNYTMYGSYIGDQYQAHLLLSTNHQKVAENGGITNDNYVTHPELFTESYEASEIPTVLEKNWNRNDNLHVLFTHRYNVGFNRKVRMTDDEIAAKKFAMEAKKDKEKREAQEKSKSPNGTKGGERQLDDMKSYAGRPDDAQIIGAEPSDSIKAGKRIRVDSKAVSDSLLAIERKNKEDSAWLKNEYVPVTSFIHTFKFDNYKRIYQAYQTPTDFYANTYYNVGKLVGDSIYDKTTHYSVKNTFAISLLEGFNKWAKAGVKAFITSDLRHFTLPDTLARTIGYNEHNLSIGGQISKTLGRTLHYNAIAETWLTGEDAGQLKLDVSADVNFKLFGDTLTLAASGFFYRLNPGFYYRHYHSRHFWWDNTDMSKILHTRIQALLHYKKTRTMLRFAIDEIKNYTYFAQSYDINSDYTRSNNAVSVQQESSGISLLTLALTQDFTFGPINWESVVTYQNSSKKSVLPVPTLNIYTNLYLRFKIARVLKCDFGADLRYFTKYYAPDYSPALGQYTVQTGSNMVEIGEYPIVNVYANFHLKRTRFFIMASHINAGLGKKNYFLTPHYPLNERVIRFGLSWNFFN